MGFDYATSDGTAVVGEDYRDDASARSRFARGERTKTVTVPVLDDVVDEGSETFMLCPCQRDRMRISGTARRPTQSRTAGPMPQAWITRLGCTVAGLVIDAVEARMTAPRSPGAGLSLGGQRLDLGLAFEPSDIRSSARAIALPRPAMRVYAWGPCGERSDQQVNINL